MFTVCFQTFLVSLLGKDPTFNHSFILFDVDKSSWQDKALNQTIQIFVFTPNSFHHTSVYEAIKQHKSKRKGVKFWVNRHYCRFKILIDILWRYCGGWWEKEFVTSW